MQIDQIKSDSKKMNDSLSTLPAEILDEVSYIALVGITGVVPNRKLPGCFEIGQMIIPYSWSTSPQGNRRTLLSNGDIEMTISSDLTVNEPINASVQSIVDLWIRVESQSDSVILRASLERTKWISLLADEFGVSKDFVINLTKCYPQLRRICE